MTVDLEPESKFSQRMPHQNNNFLASNILLKICKSEALSSTREVYAHQIADFKVGEPQQTIESPPPEFMNNTLFLKFLISD